MDNGTASSHLNVCDLSNRMDDKIVKQQVQVVELSLCFIFFKNFSRKVLTHLPQGPILPQL